MALHLQDGLISTLHYGNLIHICAHSHLHLSWHYAPRNIHTSFRSRGVHPLGSGLNRQSFCSSGYVSPTRFGEACKRDAGDYPARHYHTPYCTKSTSSAKPRHNRRRKCSFPFRRRRRQKRCTRSATRIQEFCPLDFRIMQN